MSRSLPLKTNAKTRGPRTGVATKAEAASNSSDKKNIILIITDQQRTVQWFPPGWEEQNLPAMNFLKRHGLSFSDAVNNTCACTPSRTTIFTGTYPPRNYSNFTLTEFYQNGGTVNNLATPYNIPEENNTNSPTGGPYPAPLSDSETQLDITLPNLATVLADAGYDTFYKGKYHLSKGVLGYDNVYYEADTTRYGFRQWNPPDAGQDAQIQNYGGGNADNDKRFVDDAVAFLQDRIDNPDRYKKPFCLIFSLVNPHDVLGYPANWQGPQDNGGYDWKALIGDIGLPPTIDENLRKNYKPTSQQNWLTLMNLQGSLNGDQKDNYLNFYGNLMKLVDHRIMELLDLFQKPTGKRLWEETMIIRTSDHGEMGLTHGGQRQKWFNVYQETLKVPLIWSNPVMFKKPAVSKALVSLVDLLPTLASFCGIKDVARYGMQGNDYSSLFTNPSGKFQNYTYFINTDVKAGQAIAQAALPPNNIAMVRDAHFKFARYYGGQTPAGTTSKEIQEEFYNLKDDIDPVSGEALELRNKSAWAQLKGAPWKVSPLEKKKRAELEALLDKAIKQGVLTPQPRPIPPVGMRPRAKVVTNAWGGDVAGTPEVFQVIFYSQRTYRYTLQVASGSGWADVASTTDLIPTTLDGNNGPMLFQAQPAVVKRPVYRVARTDANDLVTYEDVVWEDYTQA
jgi:choline-sulfatase